MRRREFLKSAASVVAAAALPGTAALSKAAAATDDKMRIEYYVSRDGNMVPAPKESSLQRVYFMDADYNPLLVKLAMTGKDGVLIAEEPKVPFKISCGDWVDGFGWMYLVADNGGSGYMPGELGRNVLLNAEVSKSRAKAVEAAVEAARKAGIATSPEIARRMEKARGIVENVRPDDSPSAAARKYWDALCETLWAGELVALD
ncbi:MAG: hypothetical protein ACPL7K_03455, partial [Armatimonadota bacterium]